MKIIFFKNLLQDKTSLYLSLIYFLFSIYLMFFIYPHEDALILFRYVENFASNYEIVFNLGGEKTEGATDFLWFSLISILKIAGLNVVLSSILINTLSLLLIIFSIRRYFLNKESILYTLILIFSFLNIGPIFGSSLYGFSTLFFLFLGLQCYISATSKSFKSWIIFSILLCLTRPEGIFIFLPTIFIKYFLSKLECKTKFYKSLLIIILVGMLYFLLRYLYFQNFLPLPLQVKNIGGEQNISRVIAIGVQIMNSFLMVILFSSIFSILKNYKKIIKKINVKFFITTYLIWFFYLVILSGAYLSQNIVHRFYAPFYFFIFLNFLFFFSFLLEKEKKIILFLLIISSLDSSNLILNILGKEKIYRNNTILTVYPNFNDHKNTLVEVGKVLKDDKLKIMLTEAGAIPYISKQSEITDLIGLNSNLFSKRPINCNDIKEISPDIIEIDISALENFDLEKFTKINPKNFCGFYNKSDLFEEFLISKKFTLIEKYKKTKIDNHKNATVTVAPNNIVFCLLNNDNYPLVFNNRLKPDQFYFIRDKNFKKIKNSCNTEKSGYFTDLIRNYYQ